MCFLLDVNASARNTALLQRKGMIWEMQVHWGMLWFTSMEMSYWVKWWTCSVYYFPAKTDYFFSLWAEEHERLVNWCVIMLIRQQNQKWTRGREIYHSQNTGLQFSSDFWEWLFWKKWTKSWLRWSQWNVTIILNRDRIPAYFSLHFHMPLFLVLWILCIHSALQIGSFFS